MYSFAILLSKTTLRSVNSFEEVVDLIRYQVLFVTKFLILGLVVFSIFGKIHIKEDVITMNMDADMATILLRLILLTKNEVSQQYDNINAINKIVISHKLLMLLRIVSIISLIGLRNNSLSINAPLLMLKIVKDNSVKNNNEKTMAINIAELFLENKLTIAYKGNINIDNKHVAIKESIIELKIVMTVNPVLNWNMVKNNLSKKTKNIRSNVLMIYVCIQD